MRSGRNCAGNSLFRDQTQRGQRARGLAGQLSEEPFDLATRACGNPMAAIAKFHANVLKVLHVDQYIVGNWCFAPRMQSANGAYLPSVALA